MRQDLNGEELLTFAAQLADAAGQAILPYFRGNALSTSNKDEGGFDPVTVADRAAERAMRDLLDDLRPKDGILGEEYGTKEGSSGLTWVLDPIDGTRGFISGTPTWGTLIALSDRNGPMMGIIDQPYIGERFIGGFGVGRVDGPHGSQELATKTTTALEDAILFTTFPEVGSPEERAGFESVAEKTKLTRFGMDCYAYGLLAAGQIDLVIEASLQPYDIQAPIAVIEAAGGVVTDWQGGPAYNGGRCLAAANATLHAEALKFLSRV